MLNPAKLEPAHLLQGSVEVRCFRASSSTCTSETSRAANAYFWQTTMKNSSSRSGSYCLSGMGDESGSLLLSGRVFPGETGGMYAVELCTRARWAVLVGGKSQLAVVRESGLARAPARRMRLRRCQRRPAALGLPYRIRRRRRIIRMRRRWWADAIIVPRLCLRPCKANA